MRSTRRYKLYDSYRRLNRQTLTELPRKQESCQKVLQRLLATLARRVTLAM